MVVDARVATVAVLSACAGAIHLAMAPIHAGEARREAVAFAVVGALQLAGAGTVLAGRRARRGGGGGPASGADRRPAAMVATVALGVLAAVAWAWSRRWALPFDLGGPEEAGLVDGLTAGFELAALAAALVPGPVPLLPLLPLHLASVVATVAVLATPSTADHGHQGDLGHGHGDVAAGADCPEAGLDGPPVTDPPLDFPGERLPPDRAAALRALAVASEPLPCGAVASSSHGHGDDDQPESALPAGDQARFDAQWAEATAAATRLATREAASAAGYVQASPQNPGVGTHWIDWSLVDAPFDPARPSMLLFDERPGRAPRLVGFSYWTRSAPGAPDGFAGSNDVWHRHTGLCFVEGWLFREGVPSADRCAGDWLNGTDLWMLHAWVVADLPNPAGRFAGRHRVLCPGDAEAIADALTCDPVGS